MLEDASSKPGKTWLTKILIASAAVLLLAAPVLTFFIGRETAASEEPLVVERVSDYDFNVLNEILEILHDDYARPDNLDDQTLYEAAIDGFLGVLNDSGTYYIDPETYRVSTTPVLSGGFNGIGATISVQNGEIVIVAPIKGTPAERAGLISGDVITAVDGESIAGWTLEKTVLQIRGERGTEVVLSIRHADDSEEDIPIIRDRVEIESVITVPPGGALRDADGNVVEAIGYIQIREFSPKTAQELDAAVRDVVSQGAQGIILDVRRNLGGSLSATISSADLFLDTGTIVIQRESDGEETAFVARQGQAAPGVPIVILMDRFSASASEILAAALQENGRAILIGETTFGKGTVNSPRELSDGGALFVTIAQWLTPSGILIDKVGIRPDIEVLPTDEEIDMRLDVQLFRAIEVLQGQVLAP